jgi:hypothetical protein
MHAVYVNVTIAQSQFDAAQKALKEQVVPQVRSAPGFVKGYWTIDADRRSGVSLVVFKSEQEAKNAADRIRTNPPPPGVTLGTVDVREVVADA